MYCEGFVSGLNAKIRKQEKQQRLEAQNDSRALIILDRRADLIERKEDLAQSWLKEACGVKLVSGNRRFGANGSREAWDEGRADGRRADVNALRRRKICAS